MSNAKLLLKAIDIAYPNAILKGDGQPFIRPHGFGIYTAADTIGFYYCNIDGDRFYFATRLEAAIDLAVEIGMDIKEARAVISAGKAVK